MLHCNTDKNVKVHIDFSVLVKTLAWNICADRIHCIVLHNLAMYALCSNWFDTFCKNRRLLLLVVLRVLCCSMFLFWTGHFIKVSLNLTYLHCLQHFVNIFSTDLFFWMFCLLLPIFVCYLCFPSLHSQNFNLSDLRGVQPC